ncbi:MAG: hypothetical protein PHC89_01635 [Candidatus Pacebacteria bacterium]|nr:hypothetical protein [Candidatus Paceibacterota bacterium]
MNKKYFFKGGVGILSCQTEDDGISNAESFHFFPREAIEELNFITWGSTIVTDEDWVRENEKEFDFFVKEREHCILSKEQLGEVHKIIRENPEKTFWILGSEEIIQNFLPYSDRILVLRIYPKGKFSSSKFFPFFRDNFEIIGKGKFQKEKKLPYQTEMWKRNKKTLEK